jgi:Glyoxalase-like domain
VQIDHVIYATGDLEEAAARIEAELGLVAVEGGRHEGLGTHNRIVPVGAGYLELMAVVDPESAASSELARRLHARIADVREGLLGWAVTVDDLEGVAARLGTPIITIKREGLSARLTGLMEALQEPFLPFFITRDPGVPDPGAAVDAGGVTWVEVAGDAARLERWLGDSGVPVRVVEGSDGVRAMGIGQHELRTRG